MWGTHSGILEVQQNKIQYPEPRSLGHLLKFASIFVTMCCSLKGICFDLHIFGNPKPAETDGRAEFFVRRVPDPAPEANRSTAGSAGPSVPSLQP